MSPKATILIVDDEPDLREVLEEYFVAQGYAALTADSATAARALAAEHPVDVALLDITMPGEDGLSLARHLRERYQQACDHHADFRGRLWSIASSASRSGRTTM